MVAGGLPTIQVLLDDGTGTFPYDVTTYARLVEGYTCRRGRQDELSSVTAGDFTLTLDNTDGRFTVGSTLIASPSPIKMDAQVQVRVTPAGGSAVTRFTQYVQSWPTEWPDGSDLFSTAAISGTDMQSQGERRAMRSMVEETILLDQPSPYYTLGEPGIATAASDSSGNQGPALTVVGSGTPVVFGNATGLGTDGLTAAQFAGGQYLSTATSVTAGVLECFFLATAAPAAFAAILALGGDVIGLGTDGKIHTGGGADLTSPVVADGHFHSLSWQNGHVLVDGVDVGAPTLFPTGGNLSVGGGAGAAPFVGTIAHVAAFASLSTGLAATHSTAGLTGFAGESGSTRINRIATCAGIYIGTLDAGLTNVPAGAISGVSAWAAIQQAADAELGVVFIDAFGSLIFHNRNRVAAKTAPDVTIDANFLAEGTRFEYDMQGVVNYFEVTATATGVKQVVWNKTSEVTNKHGRYPNPGDGTYLLQTDAEALDRANWIVATHAEPAARVGSLAFDVLTMTAAQQQQMLTLEPDSWLRVTGLPGQTVGGTTADFIVQGFADALNAGEWTFTLNAANKPVLYPSVWILDDTTYSVLDSTTRLYV
jgi:hypothetical protein